MSSSSANPSAARAALENEQLTALWKSYHESTQEVRYCPYIIHTSLDRTLFSDR